MQQPNTAMMLARTPSISYRSAISPPGLRGQLIAVGTLVARCHRVAGAVTRPRLPQNAACRFPALRSSEVGSQWSC